MKNDIQHLFISSDSTLLSALRQMNSTQHKLLIVIKDDRYRGLISIGDVQRSIIRGVELTSPIEAVIRGNLTVASIHDDRDSVKNLMREKKIEFMPIVDDIGGISEIIFWEELFENKIDDNRKRLNLPVVVMAGGKGTRLKPLTNVIPKPLIPVGDKTILEEIMDQFEGIGCNQFFMSVNFKVDILKFYLENLEHKYNIDFFQEDKPLGTIGSVSLLKGKINSPFFVSNCDIVIDQDYRDVYDYHVGNHNDLTIVTAVKSFRIPYGVIETGEDGLMLGLKEKPEINYMINTGVYILNPELINEIPEGQFFHITDLMKIIKARRGRIGCFPVSENAWRDMGEWSEYLKMINVL